MSNIRHKIVLVDDNLATLNQGKNLLKPFYKVYTVQSAATLFEILEEDAPDLILLDVEMPDMDGFETIAKLKADARYKDIPVIFLTSKSDEVSERKGFSLGAVDYIAKPFSEPLLLKRISNQILYDRIQSAVRDYAKDFEAMSYEIIKETRRAELAEESNKAKSLFLAKMSHELRTPMNSIIGFLELAQADDITPQTKKYLDKINENAEWLLAIINDILDISKIESGKIELEHTPFNLQDIVTYCQTVIAPQVEEKSLSIVFNVDPQAGKMLLGDPIKLRHAILNILSNAVKFTDNGTITLSVSIKDQSDKNLTLRFEIRDTGIGIDPDKMEKIFEPFTQADNSITRKFGGTGLGLAITKNYVEMMGGEMKIDSAPGKGSAFTFDLKFDIVSDTELSSYKIVPHDLKRPQFDGEVLVCEDNEMNQEVICINLQNVGLKTVVAENGTVGVDMVKKRLANNEKQFDLILMDIHMPIMDGLEAASKIIDMGVKTPIVAMTANVMANELEFYKKSGMAETLGKPFKTQDLWKLLMKYLPLKDAVEIDGESEAANDRKMLKSLRQNFVRSNVETHRNIVNALNAGDVKLAHRMAHSLKSNAAQIGETVLRDAAATLEAELAGGEKLLSTDEKLITLECELKQTLDRVNTILASASSEIKEQITNSDEIKKTLDKLEPMLKNRNPEVMNLLDEIKNIAGANELARRVENFEFKQALAELEKLKSK